MDKSRRNRFIYAYSRGATLQEIGDEHGITRERVRQVISKFGKIRGGRTIRVARHREELERKLDKRCLRVRGCTWKQYVELRSMRKPTVAFGQQRRNAHDRGITWELKLWDWWCIWKNSDHWENRGRNNGQYVMCRRGDVGPYAVWNVFIATCNSNTADAVVRMRGRKHSMRY